MKIFNRKNAGFTLTELLIVIAIIGLLMGLALAGMRFAQQRARDLQRQNAVRNISTALEAYYVDNRKYPSSTVTIEQLVEGTQADPYLSKYLENSFELPESVRFENIGYVTSNKNLSYLVCILPENTTKADGATISNLMTAGTDSSLSQSCLNALQD